MNKNMKAGYQGKPDAMREMAQKLMDHPGHAKDVYYSKSCADKEKMRPFKNGGHVKNDREKELDLIKIEKTLTGGRVMPSSVVKKIREDYSDNKDNKERLRHLKKVIREEEGEKWGNIKLLKHMEKSKLPESKEVTRHLEHEKRDAQDEIYDNERLLKHSEGGKMKSGYKKGGCAKPQKFAMGGIGKVRHDQSTMDGKQKGTKKCKNTSVYY